MPLDLLHIIVEHLSISGQKDLTNLILIDNVGSSVVLNLCTFIQLLM